jgi:transcriptional regulator GlxA family with amidase domain
VLGEAGLLDGRAATGHWYDIDELRRAHPTICWTKDRRFVVGGNVATTTGVTASLAFSLALVEAISDRATAERLAASLGAPASNTEHVSDLYRLNAANAARFARNMLENFRDSSDHGARQAQDGGQASGGG